LRHILFRPAEVVQAVREYQVRIQQPLPQGVVTDCGPEVSEAGGAVRFRMCISLNQGKPSSELKTVRQDILIEGPTLAAALILFCRDRKIPLPASADKSLQRFGDQIGLVTTYNPRGGTIPSALQV
jgi:hypothetical protein